MTLFRWLARGFWWLDAMAGGRVEPGRGQIFAARHPVKLGVRMGVLLAVLLTPVVVFGGGTLGWSGVGALCALAVFIGLFMTGIGFLERRRQRHYGFYRETEHTKPGG